MDTTFKTLQKSSININQIASGFWISKNLVITAGHVVDLVSQKNEVFEGFYLSENGLKSTKLNLVKSFTPRYDVAVFSTVETNPYEPIPLASVYNVGQEMYGFGYLGQQQSGRYTILKHIGSTIHNQTELIILSGQIFPGFSGSLVFNPITETICGMITSTRRSNGLVVEAYAISARTLEKCIQEILPQFKTPSLKKNRNLEEEIKVTIENPQVKQEVKRTLAKVEEYIENFEIKEAVKELKEISGNQTNRNDLIIIKSKFMHLKRNQNLGLVSYEQLRIEENQITQALLMVIENIRELG